MRHKATLLDNPIMSLGASKAIIRKANLLITNDTGPRHFAIAFDTPVITIFGPTEPEWTTGDYPLEKIVRVDVDCGPCMKRHCSTDHECMTRITADEVFEEARAVLSAQTPSPTT
jgi:heptosyltransferase-2